MPNQADIASSMIQMLSIAIPDLDTTIGTVARKMVDVTANQIAQGYVDNNILTYSWDITTKSGADLDNFVANFGFARLAAKRATGQVTFTRQTGFQNVSVIPMGTQVSTISFPNIVFNTTVPTLIQPGATGATLAIQAQVGGIAGNVGPGAIVSIITPVAGIASVTNTAATIGGIDGESDAALRARFLKTVFRSLVGTEQMFLGTALEIPEVTLANVVGAAKYHRESIALTGASVTQVLTTTGSPTGGTFTLTFESQTTAGPSTTLAAAITTTTATSLSVTSAAGFPSDNYYVKIDAEILQITAGQGTTTWTVTRGALGTTAATHLISAPVALVLPYVATAPQVQAALQALSSVGAGNMTCTGGPLPAQITITLGSIFGGNPPMITGSGAGLTGGITPWVSIVATGISTGTSTVDGAKYIYNDSTVTVGLDLDAAQIFVPNVNYTFAVGNPDVDGEYHPIVTSIDPINMPPGVYDTQFTYVPQASRNDPLRGITNRIDLFVGGQNAVEATQTAVFKASNVFNTTQGTLLYRGNYLRSDQMTQPAANNFFVPYAFNPVIDPALSSQIVIGGITYNEVDPISGIGDFWLVGDITNAGGTYSSLTGIEIASVANGQTKVQQLVTTGVPAPNQVQVITTTGSPTAGTFTLTLNGHTTTSLNWNDTAANVQAALRALAGLTGASSITATGGPLPAAINVNTGTVANPTIMTFNLTGFAPTGSTVVIAAPTFTLTFNGQTTTPLLFTDTAADVQAALVALPGVGAGNVAVFGGPLPAAITIAFGAITPHLMTTATAFTGGTATLTAKDPADQTSFALDYSFNSLPRDVANAAFAWKQVTTDLQVHAAKTLFLNVYLAVILSTGQTMNAMTPSITTAVQNYINSVSFDQVLQVSDLIGIVNQVAGVNACRFMTDQDGNPTEYAWQQVSPALGNPVMTTFATTSTPKRAIDIYIPDDTLPALNALSLKQVALNTYGVT